MRKFKNRIRTRQRSRRNNRKESELKIEFTLIHPDGSWMEDGFVTLKRELKVIQMSLADTQKELNKTIEESRILKDALKGEQSLDIQQFELNLTDLIKQVQRSRVYCTYPGYDMETNLHSLENSIGDIRKRVQFHTDKSKLLAEIMPEELIEKLKVHYHVIYINPHISV
jgi:multidrug efflux pump subunit AcrA (membrane-fusion protein)